MYKCDDCGKEFEKPKEYPVLSGEFHGIPFTQCGDGCPYCKSFWFSELKYICDECGCGIYEGERYYQLAKGGVFCEDCITEEEA